VSTVTSGLWHSLRLVAPGQPFTTRGRAALSLPGQIRADMSQARDALAALEAGGEKQLAVFGDRPLDPTLDSASHRLGWLLRLARRDGYHVLFYSSRQKRWVEIDEDLRQTPVDPPRSATVAWVVRPEVAAVVMPALSRLRPALRVVYDSMDLHYLRLERESAVTGSRGLRLQARLMKTLEARAASAADVAVAITLDEAPLLRELSGGTDVAVLPNVHEPRADDAPPLAGRSGLLFVGNYTHTPNVDAVEILAREVMPRIWARRPELVLSIVGRGLPLDRFPSLDERIACLGWVEDLDELVDRSSVLVAPLRFGAGLKGKIGFALARGLPVVTTPIGAEGFARPKGMIVSPPDEWEAFAERTAELIGDPHLWSRLSTEGVALTRREYAPTVLAERLGRILAG
jgi:glycosyltransferase involved in cell wall biosynthesis